jgi:hypothetical protein
MGNYERKSLHSAIAPVYRKINIQHSNRLSMQAVLTLKDFLVKLKSE